MLAPTRRPLKMRNSSSRCLSTETEANRSAAALICWHVPSLDLEFQGCRQADRSEDSDRVVLHRRRRAPPDEFGAQVCGASQGIEGRIVPRIQRDGIDAEITSLQVGFDAASPDGGEIQNVAAAVLPCKDHTGGAQILVQDVEICAQCACHLPSDVYCVLRDYEVEIMGRPAQQRIPDRTANQIDVSAWHERDNSWDQLRRRRIPGRVHVAYFGLFLVTICSGRPNGCVRCSPLSYDSAPDAALPNAPRTPSRRYLGWGSSSLATPSRAVGTAPRSGLRWPVLRKIHNTNEG